MKHCPFLLLSLFLLFAQCRPCAVQTPSEEALSLAERCAQVREVVRADRSLACGLDNIYKFDVPAQTPAPKGYEPFYVSTYGRHGSRYAYTPKTYSVPLELLEEGAAHDNLTEYGKSVLDQLKPFWEKSEHMVGTLTTLGWNQQVRLAETMLANYPSAFPKGARVDACSSPSVRSVLSMSAFCVGAAQVRPDLSIYEHQGPKDVQATAPNQGRNPFRYEGPVLNNPYEETSEEFFARRFPNYMDVLARMFVDPQAAIAEREPFQLFFYLYMMVAGMQSLPEDVRMDIDGIFTDEEFATMWEIDAYERFREYYVYLTPCCAVYDDIIAKADARIEAGERGADLRFGHDHVMMTLLMIADIDGFGQFPEHQDDLVATWHTFRSPMATILQFVFCRPVRGEGPVLFKALLNGEEVRQGNLESVSGPYYDWEAFKEFYLQRRKEFVL